MIYLWISMGFGEARTDCGGGFAKRERIVVEGSRSVNGSCLSVREARMDWFGTFQTSLADIFARGRPGAPYSTSRDARI